MSLKMKLVELLEESGDGYVSGNSLAGALSVSRNAVWKAVESLRAEGYDILAVTNRGYRLAGYGDALSVSGIEKNLTTKGVFVIDVRKSVSSTNTVLRELAVKGAPEGYVLVAEEQTAGKGRLGRDFHSPGGHGIYFSLLLRPGSGASSRSGTQGGGASGLGGTQGGVELITSAAAVAVAGAIEAVLGIRVGIKWVNDLFIGDRKVCGILTEATFDMETGTADSAVLGIGVNISEPESGYPDAIRSIAAPLLQSKAGFGGVRSRLIAAVLDSIWGYYQNLAGKEFLDEYRDRSVVLGRRIYVISGGEATPARALEIDDECRLKVRYDDGVVATLGSGEVSVKK